MFQRLAATKNVRRGSSHLFPSRAVDDRAFNESDVLMAGHAELAVSSAFAEEVELCGRGICRNPGCRRMDVASLLVPRILSSYVAQLVLGDEQFRLQEE
jgi:hypothetical protein